MSYQCSVCGEIHEDLPALGFNSPYYYDILSETDKESIASLTSDFCTINHVEQTDRFIRTVLHQKIREFDDTLDYGVWVSLSEKSFEDYREHFSDDLHQATYFGYLCSNIPGYETTLSLKMN